MVAATIGQVLALAMRANAALRGREPGPDWRDADAFRFCRSVRFAVARGGTPEIAARDPDHWLGRLAGAGASGVKARIVSTDAAEESIATGLIGGGSLWLIETVLARGASRWWRADWRMEGRGSAEDPWAVTYWRVDPPESPVAERPIAAIAGALRRTLAEIADCAAECAPRFEESFRDAAAVLDGEKRVAPLDALAPVALLAPEAERLFEACRTAWAFGGAGAWSDGGFPDERAGEGGRLGARLFALLQEGLAAAANSTFPAPAERG
ncbi:MAG TPA: hypothetical protein VGB08_02490 [Allosphingosinicella sp.]|jgi:hypothetical protein